MFVFVPKSYSTQSCVNRPQEETLVVSQLLSTIITVEAKLILILIIDGVVFYKIKSTL